MSDGTKSIPFHVDISRIIEVLAKQIYQSPLALLRENTQNAYDATLQRRHLGDAFSPEIQISITDREITVLDNGIGMTPEELENNYWKAGSSGKNNAEARAAGVVGTFGIGAMANFGIASQLEVTTESAKTPARTRCVAHRDNLSATSNCIDLIPEPVTGLPGTKVVARVRDDTVVNVVEATEYIRSFVRFVDLPIFVNGTLVSQRSIEAAVQEVSPELEVVNQGNELDGTLTADTLLRISRQGEVWIAARSIVFRGMPVGGEVVLRQGLHQIQTLRSYFGLAAAGVSSYYQFGGIANLSILQPTAGREAVTTESMQFLQGLVSAIDRYVSLEFSKAPISNQNTNFMNWASSHGRFDLCSHLRVQPTPSTMSLSLEDLKNTSAATPINAYDGSDPALIASYGTEDRPILVITRSSPRRNCEVGFINAYCKVNWISDRPTVLERKTQSKYTLAESAFALRMVTVLESDYFLPCNIAFGKISHGLSLTVERGGTPPEIVLDADQGTVRLILSLYDSDYGSFGSMVKDYIRTVIFPKVADLVPSSTREGAEAFLRAIRRPRDLFEYELADLGSLTDIWADYAEGRLTLPEAARRSSEVATANYQVVDRSQSQTLAQVVPDVLENERLLQEEGDPDLSPLPAISRLDVPTNAKILTIPDNEPALKGYRCFIAITDRVRRDRGEFFFQPHWTEIVWGGQKVLYIFQHHSREFGLYYDFQTSDLISEKPGGMNFPTSTLALKDTIFIPIPPQISKAFLPSENAKKRFEIRCDLLYPEASPRTNQTEK
jgi:molecular chaperone HtpG